MRTNKTAAEHDIGVLDPVKVGDTPESTLIDTVSDGPVITDHMKRLAFMAEPVTIVIVPSNDKTAPPIVTVGINGKMEYLRPGVPHTMSRAHVERLARAKSTSFSQNLDPGQGERLNTLFRSYGMDYNFQVVRDDNPMGADWLRKVLAEPQ